MKASTLLVPLCLLLWPVLPARVIAAPPRTLDAFPCASASPSADPNVGPVPTVCVSHEVVAAQGANPGNRFYVSWVSASPEAGEVQLVGGGVYPDTCAECATGRYHYVRVDQLVSGTAYAFYITSGGKRYDNGGQNWAVQLGGPLPRRPPDLILGRVKNADGTDAALAFVFVSIQKADGSANSALVSQAMSADDVGIFSIPLGDARTSDQAGPFIYDRTKDKLFIIANGPGGSTSTTVTVNVALPPQPNPPNVTLTLGRGTVTVATATPSPIPPTSTPTLLPRSPTATLQPATATLVAATETAPPTDAPPEETLPPAATWTPLPTIAPITIAPAQSTESAQETAQGTRVASAQGTVVRIATQAPPASESGGFAVPFNLVFVLGSGLAFLGALVLTAAALVVMSRQRR